MIPKSIIIHHTVSSRDKTTIQDIENWHKVRWPGFVSSLGFHIGYHFVILGDGEIVQTRRENEIGAHCIPNDGKIGIALTGNFETEKPSSAQFDALSMLLKRVKKEYGLTDKDVFGHYEKSSTLCPGKELKKWILLNRQLSILQKIVAVLMKLLRKK